ncbi:MAG: DNA polymerase III subunit delta [Pseudomonadota bacterium]
MKLNPSAANAYFRKPDPQATGLLIYGPDAMRVALKRQEVIKALIGPKGDEEMRLSRLAAGDLRKDPAQLIDALKAQGFFPGPRVAFVEDANDQSAPAILAALQDWSEGDAQIVVTAGNLKPTSKIRKAFEAHPRAMAAAVYDNPPTREEILQALKDAQLSNLGPDALDILSSLALEIEPGDFRQTLEKLSLYKLNDPEPVSADDIGACAPATAEAALDDLLNAVAEAQSAKIGPLLMRLEAQGVQPVGLCIGATRHYRTLHGIAVTGATYLKGPRADRLRRQANGLGTQRVEQALSLLLDTDLQLRSASNAPQMAVMERALIRLAMLSRR